jgi:homoserine dehydrogenase
MSARRARLVQVGVGKVGAALVRLLLQNRARWERDYGADVRYIALLDSRGAMVNVDGLDDDDLQDSLDAKAAQGSLFDTPEGVRIDATELMARLEGHEDVILVDCAAGEGTYDAYLQALRAGWRVVTANKAPLAVSQDRYDLLREAGGSRVWNEACVGAGLPVLLTLRSLLDAGDVVHEITGCLSGTLNYIISELMAGKPYSEAVRVAYERGYTEPDPRDDLSGLDVARKALILSRTYGRRMDLEEIAVAPLMPEVDPSLGVPEFMLELPKANEEYDARVEAAKREGGTLKYVARAPAEGPVTVGLETVATDSYIGLLDGPDNLLTYHTRVYRDRPLRLIGAGAGPVNTAMGLLGDILQAVRP